MEIKKNMLISELITMDERIAPLLAKEGMHCIGCMSAENETLEEAAMEHGIDRGCKFSCVSNDIKCLELN